MKTVLATIQTSCHWVYLQNHLMQLFFIALQFSHRRWMFWYPQKK